MKTIFKSLFAGALMIGMLGCSDYVTEIDPPIDVLTDDLLSSEENIPFVVTGVQARMAQSHDAVTVLAGGLSDELIFDDAVPNATFPTFREIDQGDIIFDNNSVDGVYNTLHEARYFADNLLERVDGIGSFEDASVEANARYWGNFVAGISRYWLGSYFGEVQTQGGSPINESATIPQAELYNQAITYFTTALQFADAYQAKVTNSMIGKVQLMNGNYGAAVGPLQAGLKQGDLPFESLHNNESANNWRAQAGAQRAQFVVDQRFADYIAADPNEANRILLTVQHTDPSGYVYYRQDEYPDNSSPIRIISWQEVNLMLAECTLRGQSAGDALALVNAVRAASGIDALNSVNIATLFVERDKELFTEGNRVLDQRREPTVGWHIQQGTSYSVPSTTVDVTWTPWQFLPITSQERNQNENVGE